MRHVLKMFMVAALVVAANGCGGGDDTTTTVPDTGTVKAPGLDASTATCDCNGATCGNDSCGKPTCGTCTSPQTCVNGTCKTSSCATGTTACGSNCCTASQTCQNNTTCVATTTCTGGTTKCGTMCCTANQTCQNNTTCVTTTDSCGGLCAGALNNCVSGKCECTSGASDSCGGTQKCINGTCCATPCNGVCCGGGQTCTANACTGTCTGTTCAGVCCAAGQNCDGPNGSCHTPDACNDNCTAGSADPVCDPVSGTCKCNSTSCTGGQTCVNGVCTTTSTCTGTQTACGTAPNATCCDNATQACIDGACCATGSVCGTAGNQACCAPGQTCTNNVCTGTGQCTGCTNGETCNTTNGHCECNPQPDSCALATSEGFRCDQATLRCAAWTAIQAGCTGCAKGQVCVPVADIGAVDSTGNAYKDPYTDTAGAKACTCVPSGYSTTQPLDSCEANGQVCDDANFDPTAPTAMSCRAPAQGDDCLKTVSTCTGTGVTCEELTSSTDGSKFDLCLQICSDTSACTDLASNCSAPTGVTGTTKYCLINICAQPWTLDYQNGKGTEDATQRAKYYKACDAAATGDGWCTPYTEQGWDASGKSQYLDVGYCIQGGTAATLGACDPAADRATLSQVCPSGQTCDTVSGNPTAAQTLGNFKGVCRTDCNAAPTPNPTAACGTGFTCLDASVGAQADQLCADTTQANYQDYCGWLQAARLGFCEPSCNAYTKTPACANDAQGNTTACALVKDDGTGFCESVSPTAKNLNATGCATKSCQQDSDCTTGGCVQYTCQTDLRSPCKGASMCIQTAQTTWTCLGLCDTHVCTLGSASDQSASTCSQCTAPNNYCTSAFCIPQGVDTTPWGGASACADCCSGSCSSGTICGTATTPEPGLCQAKE